MSSTLVAMIQMPLPPYDTPVLVALNMVVKFSEMRARVLGGIMSLKAVMRSKIDSSAERVARSEASEISESMFISMNG